MLFKLRRWVDRGATVLACAICALFMVIIVYNVAARYFFDGGIQWYMEGSQFLNVWAMLIAGVGLCASNDHLRVSIVDEMLTGGIRKVDRVVVAVLTFAFYLVLAYSSYLLTIRSRQTISTMEPLRMAHVYWMIPATSVLSALAVLLDTICHLTGKAGMNEEAGRDHILID